MNHSNHRLKKRSSTNLRYAFSPQIEIQVETPKNSKKAQIQNIGWVNIVEDKGHLTTQKTKVKKGNTFNDKSKKKRENSRNRAELKKSSTAQSKVRY